MGESTVRSDRDGYDDGLVRGMSVRDTGAAHHDARGPECLGRILT